MAAKRKTPAKKTAKKSKAPESMRLKEFIQLFRDTEEFDPTKSFCFIIGSGASKSAGIPTGAELVDRWLVEMHDMHDACDERILPAHAKIETFVGYLTEREKSILEKWSEQHLVHIPGYTFRERASFYGHIYKERFKSNPELGQKFLKKLIHHHPPSIGFHLFARVLNRTRHNVVITTNFDHLVEDAIAITENEAMQSYGHDGLSGILSESSEHPAVVKIHGDILLKTFNAENELENLSENWKTALRSLFRNYTPIVIGYGGNDPGFMDFLIEEIASWEASRRCYWFVRKNQRFDVIRRAKELGASPAIRLIECPGFAELMILLDESLGYDPLDKELREKTDQIAAELANAHTKAKADVDKHQRKLLESSVMGASSPSSERAGPAKEGTLPPPESRTWREWRDAIQSCGGSAAEEEMTKTALHALPDSLPLKAMAAARALIKKSSDRSPLREIEQLLQKSESSHGPDSDETLAVMHILAFAWDELGDYSKAEALYRRVVAERGRVLGPEHPDTLMSRNNLASALDYQGKHTEAEKEHCAVLDARERVLGLEHPDVFMSCYNLSLLMEDQGKKAEALEFARRAMAGWAKVLGEDHPDTKLAKRHVEDLEKP